MLLIRFSVLFNWVYFVPLLVLLISTYSAQITIKFHIYNGRLIVNVQLFIQQFGRGDYLALKAHM